MKRSLWNLKCRKVFSYGLDFNEYFSSRLTEKFFPFFNILRQNVQVVQSGSWFKVIGQCAKLPITIRRPHFTLNLGKPWLFGQMGNSIGHKIVSTGRFIEAPHFKDEFWPSWKFIDFEVQIEGMRPYKHFAVLS